MIQNIKKVIAVTMASIALAIPAGLALPVIGVGVVSAASSISEGICKGSNAASQEKCDSNTDFTGSTGGLQTLAQKIVNIFSVIIGAIAIIMLLYGGLRYITSGGDSGRVGNAKNTLLYAIIGLIIVALAQIIVNVVLGAANDAGQSIT